MIWFNDKGDMLDEAGRHDDMLRYVSGGHSTHKFEPAADFDDHMVFVKISEYYRRSTRIKLKSVTTGRQYSMFVDDFNNVVDAHRFVNNEIKGTFRFQKIGSGQSIMLVLPPKPTP